MAQKSAMEPLCCETSTPDLECVLRVSAIQTFVLHLKRACKPKGVDFLAKAVECYFHHTYKGQEA